MKGLIEEVRGEKRDEKEEGGGNKGEKEGQTGWDADKRGRLVHRDPSMISGAFLSSFYLYQNEEGNGDPLQQSCLEMDRGAWVGYSPFLSTLFVLKFSK